MPTATSKQLDQRRVFGERVREARSARKGDDGKAMSQEALAHAAGLDRSYVGQVERGERNVTLDNIYRIAEGLEVDPGTLL